MKTTSMRPYFFLIAAFVLLLSDIVFAANSTIIRPQENGASYSFEKLESTDELDLTAIVPNGHVVEIAGHIMDVEYFVAEVTLYDSADTEIARDRIASSQNTPFSFLLTDTAGNSDGKYRISINFEEVFGTHDRDATVRLTATSKPTYDAGSFGDAGDTARNAQSVNTNDSFDAHLAYESSLDKHRFVSLTDKADFYQYQLLADTQYDFAIAPEGSLAIDVKLTDMTGRVIDEAVAEQSGQVLNLKHTPRVTAPVLLQVSYSDLSLENHGTYKVSATDPKNAVVQKTDDATHTRLSIGSPAGWHLKQRIGTKLVAEGGLKTKGDFEAQLTLRKGIEVLEQKNISGNTSMDFVIELADAKVDSNDYSEYELELVQTKGAPEAVVFLDKDLQIVTDANSSSDAGNSFDTALSVSTGNIENNHLGAGKISRDLHIARLSDDEDIFKMHLKADTEYRFDLRHDNGAVINLDVFRADERRIAKDGMYVASKDEEVYLRAKLLNPGAADTFSYDVLVDTREVSPTPVIEVGPEEMVVETDPKDEELNALRAALAEKEAALAAANAQLEVASKTDSVRDLSLDGILEFDLNMGEKRSIHIDSVDGMERAISLKAYDAQGIALRADLYKDNEMIGSLKALGTNPDTLHFVIDGDAAYRLDLDVEKILGNKKNVSIALEETLTDYSASMIDSLSSGTFDLYLAGRQEVTDTKIIHLNNTERRYTLSLEQGEKMSVNASGNEYLGLSLALLTEDGTLLGKTASDFSGEAAAFDYKAATKGYVDLILSINEDVSRGYYGDVQLTLERDASEIVIIDEAKEIAEASEDMIDTDLLKADVSHSTGGNTNGAPLFLFVFLGVLVVGICPIIFQYYVKER